MGPPWQKIASLELPEHAIQARDGITVRPETEQLSLYMPRQVPLPNALPKRKSELSSSQFRPMQPYREQDTGSAGTNAEHVTVWRNDDILPPAALGHGEQNADEHAIN